MAILLDEIVVLDLAGEYIKLRCGEGGRRYYLSSIGFVDEGEFFCIRLDDDKKIKMIEQLIDIGAVFSEGPGWSPAEVLALYKDEGRVSKSYKVIFWRSPEDYEIKLVGK